MSQDGRARRWARRWWRERRRWQLTWLKSFDSALSSAVGWAQATGPWLPAIPCAIIIAHGAHGFLKPSRLQVSLVGAQRCLPGSIPGSSPTSHPGVGRSLTLFCLAHVTHPSLQGKREGNKRHQELMGQVLSWKWGWEVQADKSKMESPGSSLHLWEAVRALSLPGPIPAAFFTAAVSTLLLRPQASESTPIIHSG